MARISRTHCERLARIIGGQVLQSDATCVVQRLRMDLRPRIFGRRSHSALVLPFALSFENPDRQGRTLNLGELVIREREINRFVLALRRRGITVTALHNHWLFQNTPFKYIHWQSIGNPDDFARKSLAAARIAGIFR